MVENPDGQASPAELLYPFYLDVDMSMAFAAAVAGGVALEEELVDRNAQTTEAVKKLQGSLRLWRAGGFEAGRAATESSDVGSQSRVIRRHSEASLFIVLYDELRRTGQLRQDPGIEAVRVGDIVSAQLGPAIAPLRRVLDQVIRLLDLLAPIVSAEEARQESSPAPASRATRRQASRSGGHSAAGGHTDDEQGTSVLQNLRRLFGALREDLEQSGLIDIIVSREEKPSVLLTLDRPFVSAPALELLHTSQFTVVGKVTQLWTEDGAVVNPYRLSAMSLVPSLSQSIAWGVFALIGGLARSFDVESMRRMASQAIGQPVEEEAGPTTSTESGVHEETPGSNAQAGSPEASTRGGGATLGEAAHTLEGADGADPGSDTADSDIMVGDDVAALYSMVSAPAMQVLPLALCT